MASRFTQALSYGYNRVSGAYRAAEFYCLRQNNTFRSCARAVKAVSNVAFNVLTRQKETAILSSLKASSSNFVFLAYKGLLGNRLDIFIQSMGALIVLRTLQFKPDNNPAMEDFIFKEQAKSLIGFPIHLLAESFPGIGVVWGYGIFNSR